MGKVHLQNGSVTSRTIREYVRVSSMSLGTWSGRSECVAFQEVAVSLGPVCGRSSNPHLQVPSGSRSTNCLKPRDRGNGRYCSVSQI